MSRLALALALVCALLLGAVVFLWQRGRTEAANHSRELEAAKLKAEDTIVAEQEKRKKVEKDLADLLAKNSDLRDAYEELKKKAGSLKPVVIISGNTEPGPTEGEPIHDKDKPKEPQEAHQGSTEAGAQEARVPPAECLLVKGGTAEIRFSEILAETKAGNVVMVGTAECWRLTPTPASVVYKGKFSHDTKLEMPKPPDSPGWGFGLWAGVNQGGALLGPAVAAPPLKILSWQLDATASIGANLAGAWGLGVSVVVR